MYGVLVVADRPPRSDWAEIVEDLMKSIEDDARALGLQLRRGGNIMNSNDNEESLTTNLGRMLKGGARIVLVVLGSDSYAYVKKVGDALGLPTQCLRWKNVENRPRGYLQNVMLKINTKMGGTNHTLVSRAPTTGAKFQDPPNSLSWIFDRPTMLVGIDLSREPGTDRESMVAVVASMDGRASQYHAFLSAQSSRDEMVRGLEAEMQKAFEAFKARNRVMPSHVIVYRDGVSDGQFDAVIREELPGIKNAIAYMGCSEEDVKVSIIICQKRHHTRIVYKETTPEGTTIINPCPGLVVDATGGANSISSATINEFYLNSHAAIQGTSKPCKYSLIYDDIGFKTSELELLTYWLCALYCRANKTVSYATPAYYAHWASQRCRLLVSAGATGFDLSQISDTWREAGRPSTMFFV